MLVLTLKQPWAWMVIYGTKPLENRRWWNKLCQALMSECEPFAVHVGEKVTRSYYADAVEFARQEDPELVVPSMEELVYGALLGTAVIWGKYTPEQWRPWGEEGHVPWHMEGQYGWALRDRTPLPSPIPMKGKQGFWSVDDALVRQAP